jgi:glycosyltransferase involved in cell wall biosynthesis
MPLNILYHHRTQGRGAEGVHITSIVSALQAMGHRVTVVSPPGVDPVKSVHSAPVDKAEVKTGGMQSVWKWVSRHLPNAIFELAEIGYNAMAWWRLRQVMSTQKFDLVYERYAFYMVAGARLAQRHGIPFVLEANEVSGIENRARPQSFARLCGRFERHLFARCTAIHTVSSHLKKRILAQGVDDARVHVVPNAFDVDKVKGRVRQPELAERLGLQGKTTYGFVGWFDHWDRLDLLIDIHADLLRRHPDARLLLVGDGPVTPALVEQANMLGIADTVVFTGAVPRQQVFDYVALLDIAVLPHSNDFGSPVVMFEFMGLKVPVVAPRLEPILDVQSDGRTALLFEPLNREQCTRAIERLLSSPDLRERLARCAFDKLVGEHTWQRNACRIVESAKSPPQEGSEPRAGAAIEASAGHGARPSVCLVAELPPPTGGMAVQAERLGNSLRAEGHAVINVRSNALAHDSALRRVKYLRGVVNALMFFGLLVWRLPRARITHVFSTSYLSFFLFTLPPVLLGRLLGRRVVVHYHGGNAGEFLDEWGWLARPVLRAAHALIVPSGFLVDVFARHGLAAQPIANTLALENFCYALREPLRPHVLIARHLRAPYNVSCGIRAFAQVAQAHPGASLTVAGAGEERAALERLAHSLGLAGQVRFVGNIDNHRMRDLFEVSHIYLNSSQWDNQPVSILEAFACGLPVVSTAVGGIPYMVRDGHDGLLAPHDDANALARHMMRLLDDPALARSLSEQGRLRVQEYTWPRIYPQLASIYGGAASPPAQAACVAELPVPPESTAWVSDD